MTIEELEKIPFRFVSHLNMEGEHCTTYVSYDGRIGFCDHQPYKDDEPHGKPYRHWMVLGKVYKSKKKFLEAIKEISTMEVKKGGIE